MTNSLRDSKEKIEIKLKRKMREWKYLKESRTDFTRLFSVYEKELNLVLSELSEYHQVDSSVETSDNDCGKEGELNFDENLNSEDANFETSENDQIINNPPWVRKLYKKIALQTHPDKLEKLDIDEDEKFKREKIFKDAASCLKNKQYELLLDFADDLDIEIEIADKHCLEIIEKAIQRLSENMETHQKLVPWVWGELNEVVQRIDLIFYIWESIGEKIIPREVVEDYMEYYENCETTLEWKNKHAKAQQIRIAQRKKGTRPGPSIGQLRREK